MVMLVVRGEEEREEKYSQHADFLSLFHADVTIAHASTAKVIHLCWYISHFSAFFLFIFSISLPHFDLILTTGRWEKKQFESFPLNLNALFFPVEIRFYSRVFFSFYHSTNSINAGSVFDMWMSFGINGKGTKEKDDNQCYCQDILT